MKIKIILSVFYLIFLLNSNLLGDENNKELRVGLLAPLSGPYSEIGNSLLYSLQLALEEIDDKRFDMCLTSPPYFDLEVYSHESTQSIKKYETYDEWIEKFIKPIIEYVSGHVDKYSCWSVKNIKTDKKYNLLDDVIKIHEENGWKLDRQFAIKKNTTKNKSTDGDVTYVFVKE